MGSTRGRWVEPDEEWRRAEETRGGGVEGKPTKGKGGGNDPCVVTVWRKVMSSFRVKWC
jgi:hypothetical protein